MDTCPPVLFGGHSTAQLNGHYGFDSAIMSEIENAETSDGIRQILFNNFNLDEGLISEEDTETVQWACRIVATRAAKLSATAVAAVLVQTDHAIIGGGYPNSNGKTDEMIMIGVDGRYVIFVPCMSKVTSSCLSLVQHYPGFEERLREALRDIVGADVEKRVIIGLAKDGSGVGGELKFILFFLKKN